MKRRVLVDYYPNLMSYIVVRAKLDDRFTEYLTRQGWKTKKATEAVVFDETMLWSEQEIYLLKQELEKIDLVKRKRILGKKK